MRSILKCPVCQGRLTVGATAATCELHHSFDLARSGYLNLLLPDQRRSTEPGDSPDMMRHRRAFLLAGFYNDVAQATAAAVSDALNGRAHANIADLGCGEGFFLAHLKRARAAHPAHHYYGIDISRSGVKMATTYDRAITWIVAGLHSSPFEARSLDVVLSMCAPIAGEEFRRVIRDNGALITVTPGPDHLDALRAIIYPSVVPHSPTPALLADDTRFTLSGSSRVRYSIALESQAVIMDLLSMTPFYWNISLETRARVEACSRLGVTVDLAVNVFRPRPAESAQSK